DRTRPECVRRGDRLCAGARVPPQMGFLPAAARRDGTDGCAPLSSARRPLCRGFQRRTAVAPGSLHPRDDACLAGADAWPLVPGAYAAPLCNLPLQPEARMAAPPLRARTAGGDCAALLAADTRCDDRRGAGGRGLPGDPAVCGTPQGMTPCA